MDSRASLLRRRQPDTPMRESRVFSTSAGLAHFTVGGPRTPIMSMIPCPHCGADIQADAKFCRDCGSSDTDGWRQEGWDGDADDEDFDYDAYVDEHHSSRLTNTTTSPLWRFVAVILLLSFLGWAFSLF